MPNSYRQLFEDVISGQAKEEINRKKLMLQDDLEINKYLLELNHGGFRCKECEGLYRPDVRKNKIKKIPIRYICKCSSLSLQADTALRGTKASLKKWARGLELANPSVQQLRKQLKIHSDTAIHFREIFSQLGLIKPTQKATSLGLQMEELDKAAEAAHEIIRDYVAAKKFFLKSEILFSLRKISTDMEAND